MGLKHTRGAVYDLKYHVVWVPKYRRMVLSKHVAKRLKEVLADPDSWIRRRLRCLLWRQWCRRRWKELVRRGVGKDVASAAVMTGHGPWKMSHVGPIQIALPNACFDSLALPRLADMGRI